MKKGVTSQVLSCPPASCRNFYGACATCYGPAGHVVNEDEEDEEVEDYFIWRSGPVHSWKNRNRYKRPFQLRKCPGRCPKSRIHHDHDYFVNQVGRGLSCSIVPCATPQLPELSDWPLTNPFLTTPLHSWDTCFCKSPFIYLSCKSSFILDFSLQKGVEAIANQMLLLEGH